MKLHAWILSGLKSFYYGQTVSRWLVADEIEQYCGCSVTTTRSSIQRDQKINMDKKAKKRIEVLRKRHEKCRQQLAGAKTQTDDPDEITKIENEIKEIEAEIEKLKNS